MNSITIGEYMTTYKTTKSIKSNYHTLDNSKKVYEYIQEQIVPHFHELPLYEHFFMIVVNRQNTVMGHHVISQGGTSATVVDTKKVFAKALTTPKCEGIIFGHNHPSGKLSPSRHDKEITQKCKEGARILGINLLDHIIFRVEDESTPEYQSEMYYSFADEGLI